LDEIIAFNQGIGKIISGTWADAGVFEGWTVEKKTEFHSSILP